MALLGVIVMTFAGCETNPDWLSGNGGNGGNGGNSGNGGSSSSSVAKDGCLPGVFSVNVGTKVSFSMGNLLYLASEDRWAFAPRQYQTVGGKYEGNIFHNKVKSNNELASETYDGWIDSYAWGTGDRPWVRGGDVTEYTTYHEWGDNKISNGGNRTKQWRTLTMDEWYYLTNIRTDAQKKIGVCKLQNALYQASMDSYSDTYCVVLIPDTWTCPAGITFRSLYDLGYEWNDNHGDGYWWGRDYHYDANVYTMNDFDKLEASGVVFLVSCGRIDGSNPTRYIEFSDNGHYWSASARQSAGSQDPHAAAYFFDMRELWPTIAWSPNACLSVRLVKDVK